MGKILVLSDSHGDTSNLVEIIDRESPDLMIHLGDGWNDIEEIHRECEEIPLEHVIGNCDFNNMIDEKLVTFEGKKFFICHGHKYNVKSNYNNVLYRGMELSVDAVLFGHTHIPFNEEIDGVLLFNPGSVKDMSMYGISTPTYGVITVEDGKICAEVKNFYLSERRPPLL